MDRTLNTFSFLLKLLDKNFANAKKAYNLANFLWFILWKDSYKDAYIYIELDTKNFF